ncbi:unnamed protein product [Aphanomyces euteiches]
MASTSAPAEEVAAVGGGGKEIIRPGTHSFVVSGTTFQVDTKYKFIKPIGHGAYGVVISSQNTETGDKVAIKKVSKAFEDLVDAKRILREIKLLQHFDHENIITIVDLLPPPSISHFEDVYIISDLMETDLHRIIYSRQPLSDDHIQYFLYQCYPASGVEPDEDNMELTEYVVTRWYRAPEIMLSTKEYTKAIDIWSTGCIFAELLGRKPMFPGDDYIHQLQIICDKLGTPTEEELHFVTSEKARRFMKSQPNKPKIPLDKLFPNVKSNALDLLDKMLVFDPTKRISVEEALEHPYLESLHNSEDEPKVFIIFGSQLRNFQSTTPFSFEFEKENLTKGRLQELIFEFVLTFSM